MAYRYDSDLEFLGKCSNEELKNLFDILVYDKDQKKRISETLTKSEEYKKYGDFYSIYWKRIAEEYQYFGGNSFANFVRGSGVKYEEILNDLMKELKISYSKSDSIEEREEKLILKFFDDMLDNISEDEKIEMVKIAGIKTNTLNKQALVTAAGAIFKCGGFTSYKISVIVANYVSRMILGRGLSFAANATLTKSLSILVGPIGWGVTGIWTLIDLAGPAKRVIIPATLMICCLRKELKARIEETKMNNDIFDIVRVMDIEKCYEILGLDGRSTREDLEKRYKENIKRFEKIDDTIKDEKSLELLKERKKEIEDSYLILKEYFDNKETYSKDRWLIICPKCKSKMSISKTEGKKRCPNCGNISYIKKI